MGGREKMGRGGKAKKILLFFPCKEEGEGGREEGERDFS